MHAQIVNIIRLKVQRSTTREECQFPTSKPPFHVHQLVNCEWLPCSCSWHGRQVRLPLQKRIKIGGS